MDKKNRKNGLSKNVFLDVCGCVRYTRGFLVAAGGAIKNAPILAHAGTPTKEVKFEAAYLTNWPSKAARRSPRA
jgi:hypothetical protein